MSVDLKNKDIVSILNDLDRETILYLCERAQDMYDLEKSGNRYSLNKTFSDENTKVLAYMFYEPSTRTRFRFDSAMRELGGKRDGFTGSEGTSVKKKETIRDTVKMMEANHFDAIVMRHPNDGALQWAADVANIPVINAGDGKNEHPTQALLDLFTIYNDGEKNLDSLNIGLGGDLGHGRTIKSLTFALSHFDDIVVRWAAKDVLGMPEELSEKLKDKGVKVIQENCVEDVLKNSQVYYMTRPQVERIKGVSEKELSKILCEYRISFKKVKYSSARLMHPLPVNGELQEIETAVYFTKNQIFYQQAENGIFLSKALLYEILKDAPQLQFQKDLHESLKEGNGQLNRTISKRDKRNLSIDVIQNGWVIDHLKYGIREELEKILDIKDKTLTAGGDFEESNKSILKTDGTLCERDFKKIAMYSPEATINQIIRGRVVSKFIYLLCQNDNCISREILEDVPPKFYNDDGTIRCRYCRKSYNIERGRLTESDKRLFMRGLPKEIIPVKYE